MSGTAEQRLGKRLQEARQAAGLTQQGLCQKAGLSYSTLAKIERGAIKAPSIFTVRQIAAALGTTLDELVGVPAPLGKQRKQSKSGVRFVYFDVNNCLVRFYQKAFTQVAADCELPYDVVETAFFSFNAQICRGEMTFDEFNNELGKLLGLPTFDWRQYYLSTTEATPYTGELAEWVSEHYGIGLLTNSMPGLVEEMMDRGLLPKVEYDVIIDSSKVHLLKPERKIYEIAQERAGCEPQEILFTDDSRTNLMAAEKLGWHVMGFDDSRPKESTARLREVLALA